MSYWECESGSIHHHNVEDLWPFQDDWFHCIVTSPPYWALRDYGIEGQLGLEPTVQEYVARMVAVMREAKRVLRPDGTLWLNIGDSYSRGRTGRADSAKMYASGEGLTNRESNRRDRAAVRGNMRTGGGGLKAKDLCLVPERLAIALQDDGWYVRSRVAWCKPNPMPESVRDRPTSAWEHIWMLTKAPRYYYDWFAVRTPVKGLGYPNGEIHSPNGQGFRKNRKRPGKHPAGWGTGGAHDAILHNQGLRSSGNKERRKGTNPSHPDRGETVPWIGRAANLRNWWDIATKPFPGNHFATFPDTLVNRCVQASTSDKGCCEVCGSPMVRIVEPTEEYAENLGDWADYTKDAEEGRGKSVDAGQRDTKRGGSIISDYRSVGWERTCECGKNTVACRVLDPFGGAMTVGIVAHRMGRNWESTEISEKYCALGRDRFQKETGCQIRLL